MERRILNPWTWQDTYGFVQANEVTGGQRVVYCAGQTSVDADGWTAELRIPFSQLRFSADARQTWGIQLSRRISRTSEVTVLNHTPKSERGGVARYAHLDGLSELRPGRRAELQPYVMARSEHLDIVNDGAWIG